MNSITVTFEKQGEKYTRLVTFPDGKCVTEQDIEIKKQWHSPETWQWSKPLHEYSREELAREGNDIAHALLGQQGCDFLASLGAALEPNPPGNETNPQILILEHTSLPEIARIPWEIACIGSEFIVTQRFIPIIRSVCPSVFASSRKPQGAIWQPRGVAPTGLPLPDMVSRIKSMTTKLYSDGVKQSGWQPFNGKLWQRNYYEHIIRNENELFQIREYIDNNPANWEIDAPGQPVF